MNISMLMQGAPQAYGMGGGIKFDGWQWQLLKVNLIWIPTMLPLFSLYIIGSKIRNETNTNKMYVYYLTKFLR